MRQLLTEKNGNRCLVFATHGDEHMHATVQYMDLLYHDYVMWRKPMVRKGYYVT